MAVVVGNIRVLLMPLLPPTLFEESGGGSDRRAEGSVDLFLDTQFISSSTGRMITVTVIVLDLAVPLLCDIRKRSGRALGAGYCFLLAGPSAHWRGRQGCHFVALGAEVPSSN